MISPDDAQTFAREWVKAWNDHDLEAILAHYADDVVFHSPRFEKASGRNCIVAPALFVPSWKTPSV
jgi:ketosteroid isomerase-like protein